MIIDDQLSSNHIILNTSKLKKQANNPSSIIIVTQATSNPKIGVKVGTFIALGSLKNLHKHCL